jgi:hypothetical protein
MENVFVNMVLLCFCFGERELCGFCTRFAVSRTSLSLPLPSIEKRPPTLRRNSLGEVVAEPGLLKTPKPSMDARRNAISARGGDADCPRPTEAPMIHSGDQLRERFILSDLLLLGSDFFRRSSAVSESSPKEWKPKPPPSKPKPEGEVGDPVVLSPTAFTVGGSMPPSRARGYPG